MSCPQILQLILSDPPMPTKAALPAQASLCKLVLRVPGNTWAEMEQRAPTSFHASLPFCKSY